MLLLILIYTANKLIDFALPGTLKVLCDYSKWLIIDDKEKYFPVFQDEAFINAEKKISHN